MARFKLIVFILFFLVVTSPAQLLAQSSRKFLPLSVGMKSSDVLRAWGEPDEKTIRETRRQERWDYGKRQVLFENGSVVRWRSEEQTINPAVAQLTHNLPLNTTTAEIDFLKSAPKKGPGADTANEVDSDLLDNILRDLPKDSGPDTSAPNNTASNGVAAARPGQPESVGEEEEP